VITTEGRQAAGFESRAYCGLILPEVIGKISGQSHAAVDGVPANAGIHSHSAVPLRCGRLCFSSRSDEDASVSVRPVSPVLRAFTLPR